jgi:hypothetical protein
LTVFPASNLLLHKLHSKCVTFGIKKKVQHRNNE